MNIPTSNDEKLPRKAARFAVRVSRGLSFMNAIAFVVLVGSCIAVLVKQLL